MKHERHIGSRDITLRKRRKQIKIGAPEEVNIKQKAHVKTYGKQKAPVEAYGEQKVPKESYGEQRALVKA